MRYDSIILRDLWDGIDIEYYFDEGVLKYDITLDHYANPADIRICVEGHKEIEVYYSSLNFWMSDSLSISDGGLYTYYQDTRENIDSGFILYGNNVYGIELEGYDRSRKVVIDPLVFSTFINSKWMEYAVRTRYSKNGEYYVTGFVGSSEFPTT